MSTLTAISERQLFPVGATNIGASQAAQGLQRMLSEAFSRLQETKRKRELAELREVFEECQTENWDQYGASPVTEEACVEAAKFLMLLPPSLPAPEVGAEPDGEIALDWNAGRNWLFSVSLGGRGVVSYAGMFGPRATAHGEEPFNETIPPMVLRLIQRIAQAR